jgi:hypothetical protein
MSRLLNLRGLSHSHGNEVVEMFGHCGFLDTRQKRELLPRRAQRKKILPLITLIGRIFTDRREMLAPQRTQRAQRRTRFEHTGKNAQTIKFYCAARGHTLPMQARIGLASMCAFK